MAVTLNTALIPACGSSRTLASRLTPLGILFQPTCRIKQRGAQARVLRPYPLPHYFPVAPQQGQALTSTSKGANPTGSPLQRLRRVASRADVDSDRGLSRQIVSDRCSITCGRLGAAIPLPIGTTMPSPKEALIAGARKSRLHSKALCQKNSAH